MGTLSERSAQACGMAARRAETWLAKARFTPALRQRRHAMTRAQLQPNLKEAEMTSDELRALESTRRRALWELASFSPGDPKASRPLIILDDLDRQERHSASGTDKRLELNAVRDAVPIKRHHSGIDIVLERDIPEPWRERFLQASIGSTRLPDGPYARDWKKFLSEWEVEMRHLAMHRAARRDLGID